MEIVNKIKKQLEIFEIKKKELLSELQNEFPKIFSELFVKANKFESFGWCQYTPYFSDGDECIFSVNLDYNYYINGEHFEDIADEDNFFDKELSEWVNNKYKYTPNPNYSEIDGKLIEELRNILYRIPEDFMKDLFGDHCKVTIYKNCTVDVENYEHD